MPKGTSPTETGTPSPTMPFVVSQTTVANIPKQNRIGRGSKFQPLFDRLQKLAPEQALSFPIERYTQIQGLRVKLDKLGFTITTRNLVDANGSKHLSAYIYHKEQKQATAS